LVGPSDARIPNFHKLAAQGLSFGTNASSLRYQIPKGWKLRLYRHKDFKSKKNDHLDLIGDGCLRTRPNLKKQSFGDKAESCEYLPVY
jgi:hypothetical protein